MSKKLTTEEFIEKAKLVHGDMYQYSKVEYINNTIKVIIICKVHGEFMQTPSNHLRGKQCLKCAIQLKAAKRSTGLDIFVKNANKVHSNKYDYSKTVYKNTCTSVNIVCPIHGEFTQTPHNHLLGSGCSTCAKSGFDKTKSAYLYYLKITTDDNQVLYKIGITNRTVNERFSLTELSKIEIVKQKLYKNGQDAYDWEQKLLKMYKEYQYKGPKILESGNTELFIVDIMKLWAESS